MSDTVPPFVGLGALTPRSHTSLRQGLPAVSDETGARLGSRPVGVNSHSTVLLVRSVHIAADYYRDALGFDVEFYEALPQHYAYASRGACSIHFACFENARLLPNSESVPPDMFDVYVYVDDVAEMFEEFVGRGAEIVHAPVHQGYGMREFRVRDPHGYILAFGHSVRAARGDESVSASART